MRVLLLLLPLVTLAADERTCTLRFAWWDAPATIPGPTLSLGSESEHKGFSPQVMNFTTEARNVGEVANLLVKEVTKDPKTGKDVVSWLPFGSVAIPQGDDTFGVVLITDPSGKRGAGRAFSLGPTHFPLGSVRLVNLTGRSLMLGLAGKGVQVAAGSVATHPKVFTKPEIAEIAVMAAAGGESLPVFSTKSEFSNLYRLVLFVAEAPNSEPPRFEVRTVVDFPQPEAKAPASAPASGVNGAGGANGPKPAASKPGR